MTAKVVAPKEIHLRPVHGNRGLMMAYRRKLKRLIREMQRSVEWWLGASYKRELPEIAKDASAANELQQTMRRLSKQWRKRFDEDAENLARWFAAKTLGYTDSQLKDALKKHGFAIEFTMSREMQDAYSAIINEQVGLIKSIPQEYLNEVEGLVMRSVQRGRSISDLQKQLSHRYGITQRRAVLISRDQTNKATAVITQVRQREMGITEAIWRHSGGGKEPRPSHVAANGKKYDIEKGMYLESTSGKYEWLHPGEAINCRCIAVSVIPGITE